MDPADWIETYIIEVEFLNDEDKTQYLCMSSEFDEDHQCMVEDLAITNESIWTWRFPNIRKSSSSLRWP